MFIKWSLNSPKLQVNLIKWFLCDAEATYVKTAVVFIKQCRWSFILGDKLNHVTVLFSSFLLRKPHDRAHSRELHVAVAAWSSQQLRVSPPPQQPGWPQLQRPLAVPRLPLGHRRLYQPAVRWVRRPLPLSPVSQSDGGWDFGSCIFVKMLQFLTVGTSLCFSDMTNAATFRDLSKPVGALNKERLDRLLVRRLPDCTVCFCWQVPY